MRIIQKYKNYSLSEADCINILNRQHELVEWNPKTQQ
jgi:uncharacterized cysteine cluster protein YcgN (CxxCxxCC family)